MIKINELNKHFDEEVVVSGFVDEIRNLKWVQFVVLRDETGKVQITIEKSEEKNKEIVELIDNLPVESTIKVTGKILESPKVKLNGIEQQGESRVVTISWNKISYATGYQVYKKIGKNGSWKYVNTTDADTRSYSAEIPQGKYVYWKVRAIRTLGKMTTQAAFSDSKSS